MVDDRVRAPRTRSLTLNLESPVAFLAETELAPLIRFTLVANDLSHLLALWTRSIPTPTAVRIMRGCLDRGILTVEAGDC